MKTVMASDGRLSPLRLNSQQLPQIKTWRIGGHYRVVLELEQTGTGSFHILNAQALPTSLSKDAVLKVMAEKAKA